MLNVSEAQYYETKEYDLSLAKEIESQKYHMIAIGPESWTADISYALRNTSSDALSRYCIVRLPKFSSFKEGRHMSTVMMTEGEGCRRLLLDSMDYAVKAFPRVCMLQRSGLLRLAQTSLHYGY